MRAGKLLIQITLYYLVIGMVIFVALKLWPEIRGYLPVGGVEQLISQPTKNPLQASEAVRAAHVANLGQSIFWLVVAILAALVVALPAESSARVNEAWQRIDAAARTGHEGALRLESFFVGPGVGAFAQIRPAGEITRQIVADCEQQIRNLAKLAGDS